MADYEDVKISGLIINNLTQEKYNELLAAGQIDPNQLYLTEQEEYATSEEFNSSIGSINASIESLQSTKADKSDTYTKSEVDAKVSSVYRFMGSVATIDALPVDATVGDTYNVEADGSNYAWDGENWDKLSETVDLTPYLTKEDASKTYETIENVNLHKNNTSNPHNVTKAQVGLGNVDNTSDANKPISTATQTALDKKANITDIIKDVQNISSTNIYNSINDLPELDASKNGTRYLALTNGSLPLVIYSWTYNTKTWDKIDQCRGSTVYINIETGKVYYYRSSAPHLRQFVGASEWGSITGTLSNQTDLNTVLDGKQNTLTQAQLNAVNSGITAAKVSKYNNYATEIAGKQPAGDYATNTSLSQGLSEKVDKNQGVASAGKVLAVNEQGVVEPTEIKAGGVNATYDVTNHRITFT